VTPIAVLIADDSVVVRRVMTNVLSADPHIRVVGTAGSGRIALEKIEELKPEILILDIEMPEMDGLETLRHLRRLHPRLPVIMFSTLTERAAAATLEALSLAPATTSPSRATLLVPARRWRPSGPSWFPGSRRWSHGSPERRCPHHRPWRTGGRPGPAPMSSSSWAPRSAVPTRWRRSFARSPATCPSRS
jgi:CheY-like chemotaxis protein